MADKIDRAALAQTIRELEGIDNDTRAALLELVNRKKYGLVWEEHPEDVEERLREQLPVLEEDRALALTDGGKEAPNHILIEGDNLEALTALTYTHEGKIDVIYIDPPYNTGNKDFIYNDSYVDSEDGYRHSKWLSFMSKRLRIAKRLLSDKGVIFISIDDNEQANLKLLCDEVFGERNFRNAINTRRLDKNLSQQFVGKGIQSLAVGCEYVLMYSATSEVDLFPIKREVSSERKEYGYWKGFWNAADRPTMRYELLGVKPESGQWKWEVNKANGAVANYEKFQNKQKENPSLTLEQYWEDTGRCLKFIRRRVEHTKGKNLGVEHWVEPSEGTLRTSNWSDIITTEISLDMEICFSSPKSRQLLKEIIRFGNKRNDITVLDFFAGSGTTLHATMQLNKEDGGHRQCILVQGIENDEKTKEDKKIAREVTYERNKRVIQGYTTPKGVQVEGLEHNNLRYYRTKLLPRDTGLAAQRRLMEAATELLCIKHDVYEECTMLGALRLKPRLCRYFADEGKAGMLIIYRTEAIGRLVEEIKTLPEDAELLVYVFSLDSYAMDADFEEVADRVTLCALPRAIYNAYQKVLPKKGRRQELPPLATSDENTQLTIEEGGEA